jgi:glutathione S-transferase
MTSPRKVEVYLAEKGIALEIIRLDMRGGEGRSPAYLALNPAGAVPLLEMADGQLLPESGAIIEYLEELYPSPTMLGVTPEGRGRARAIDRIANDFLYRNARVLVNTHPYLPSVRPGFPQYPEVAKVYEGQRDEYLRILESYLGSSEFLCGGQVTIADCTLFAGMQIAGMLFDYGFPERFGALREWYGRFAQRSSASLPALD